MLHCHAGTHRGHRGPGGAGKRPEDVSGLSRVVREPGRSPSSPMRQCLSPRGCSFPGPAAHVGRVVSAGRRPQAEELQVLHPQGLWCGPDGICHAGAPGLR